MERREHTRQRDRVKERETSIFRARSAANAARQVLLVIVMAAGCGGSSGTIGAVLGQQTDGRLFVRQAPPNLAAARQGVRAGDEILLINGRDVRSMSVEEVHRTLQGDVGDTVKLTLVRGGEIVRATLQLTPAMRMPEVSRNPQ